MNLVYKEHFDQVLFRESDAIASLTKTLDYETLEKIVDILIRAKEEKRRVITAGCGTSGMAARRIAHTLCCTETPAMFLSPADAPHGGMGFIQKGDVVVLLSKGGNTGEIVRYLECCKEKQAIVIGVTNNPDSILARNSDYVMWIESGEEPCPFKIMPCCSTLAAIAAWDAIALTVMRYNHFTMEDFLLIHPNGNTAQRLESAIAAENQTSSM